MSTTLLSHSKLRLALHTLREAPGATLLMLHGLGECSKRVHTPELEAWPGSVVALDFSGHGESSLPRGGGYTAEVLMADADAAIAERGPATVCGRPSKGSIRSSRRTSKVP